MGRLVQWTPERILEQLQSIGHVVGHWVTADEWSDGHYHPTAKTVIKVFGSWRAAWEAAGFAVPILEREQNPRGTWDADRILAALRAAADARGFAPTERKWVAQKLRPAVKTIRQHWGSYRQAVVAAGLKMEGDIDATMEQLQDAYNELQATLGRFPTQKEWDAWPSRPFTAQYAWQLMAWPSGHPSKIRDKAQGIALETISDPETRWIIGQIARGESLSSVAKATGLTREGVRRRVLRGKSPRKCRRTKRQVSKESSKEFAHS